MVRYERQTWNGTFFAFIRASLEWTKKNPSVDIAHLFNSRDGATWLLQLNNSSACSACSSLFNRNACRLTVSHSGIGVTHTWTYCWQMKTVNSSAKWMKKQNKMPMILIALDIHQAAFRIDTMKWELEQLATLWNGWHFAFVWITRLDQRLKCTETCLHLCTESTRLWPQTQKRISNMGQLNYIWIN